MKRRKGRTRYSSRLKQRRKRAKYWSRYYAAEDKMTRAMRSGTPSEVSKWYAERERLATVGSGRVD